MKKGRLCPLLILKNKNESKCDIKILDWKFCIWKFLVDIVCYLFVLEYQVNFPDSNEIMTNFRLKLCIPGGSKKRTRVPETVISQPRDQLIIPLAHIKNDLLENIALNFRLNR